jgi:PAS domain S-box-containing protein
VGISGPRRDLPTDSLKWTDVSIQLLLDAAPDAMLVVNQIGEIVVANSQAGKLFGFSREELVGRSIEALIPSRFHDWHIHDRENYFRDPRVRPMGLGLELFALRRDGTEIPVEINLSPITTQSGSFVISAIRDATELRRLEELKKAEAVLSQKSESEEQFRFAAQAGKMFAYKWDIATDVISCSGESAQILGIDDATPTTGRQALAKIQPDDRERFLAALINLSSEKPYLQVSYRWVRPDGSVLWLERTGQAFFDEQGRIVRMIGMVANITERKRAEEALRASQELLQAIWNNSPACIFIKDRQGHYLDFSPLFLSLPSLPREQILGKTDEEIFPPEQAAAYRANDRRVLEENRPIEFEETVEQTDGIHTSIVQKFPLRDTQGQTYAVCGFATDITERKRSEVALRESEERLRMAAQVGKMYAFDWDVATDVIIRSEEATHIYGLTGEPVPLTKQRLLASVHPEDQAIFDTTIAQSTPESPNHQISFRLLRPDGSVLWLERTGRAIFDEQGRMVRMIGMVADITERKLAEEALSKVGGRLIEAHEEERAWIARELHDDIGQQLALLANNLELMKKDPPDSATEIRSRASEQLKHVHEIAADVHTMSHRLHSSKLRYLGIVAAARGLCQEFSEQHKVEIDFTHADIPPTVPEEISLCLFRVLQEALHNAVKHSGTQHFEIELRGALDRIHLTVHDSGLGFDTQAGMNNRGLGLISMQERVNLVKGTFSLDSRPGRGTTIHAWVPISTSGESAGAGEHKPLSLGMHG